MMGTGMMGWGGYGSFGWIGMILNLVITVGVIIGIVWLVIWLMRRAGSNGSNATALFNQPPVSQPPREILQARYARGEITREQYQEILADLN